MEKIMNEWKNPPAAGYLYRNFPANLRKRQIYPASHASTRQYMILSTGSGSTRLCRKVADSLSLPEESVAAVASLFGSGATVSFHCPLP